MVVINLTTTYYTWSMPSLWIKSLHVNDGTNYPKKIYYIFKLRIILVVWLWVIWFLTTNFEHFLPLVICCHTTITVTYQVTDCKLPFMARFALVSSCKHCYKKDVPLFKRLNSATRQAPSSKVFQKKICKFKIISCSVWQMLTSDEFKNSQKALTRIYLGFLANNNI